MSEATERQAVIAEARTWIGTPFLWEACVRGAGVDCGRFVAASFNGAGITKIDIAGFKRFPASWFVNRAEPNAPSPFLEQLEQYTKEFTPTPDPLPADIVVAKLAHDWAHSAIVIEWPHVIACLSGFCVAEDKNILQSPQFGHRPMRFFRCTAWVPNV